MTTSGSNAATERKPSMKERQRQMREDAILDAAEELLTKKGLGAMTLDDLILEVGISKPTLYQHFRSKEELIVSIMTRGLRDATRKIHELEAELPPGKALRAIIDWIVGIHADDGCPVTDLCATLSVMAQEPIRDHERIFCGEVERLFKRAQQEGTVRPEVSAMLVAQMLMSVAKDSRYQELIESGRTDFESLRKALAVLLLGQA